MDVPQTRAYLNWRRMPLWMRLQKSSTVALPREMTTGSL